MAMNLRIACPVFISAFVVLVGFVAAPLSASAIELQPGTWQDSETGTENGKPVQPKTETSCMTPEEAKDPLKGFSPEKDMKGQCKTLEVKQSPAGIKMHLVCGDPKQFSMDIAIDYMFNNPRSYSGTVKSAVTMMGKTTTTDKKIEGKWLSAQCKKK
jgi:hypothetical protein